MDNEINMIKVYEKEQEAKNNIERKLNKEYCGIYNSIDDLDKKLGKKLRINDIFIEENYLHNNGDDNVFVVNKNCVDFMFVVEYLKENKVELKYISIL